MVDKKLLVSMVNIAYQSVNINNPTLPKEWEILCTSKEISNYEYKFQSVVFINKKDKEIVLAGAGTRIGNYTIGESFADLSADYDIFTHNIPKKFSVSAIKFSNEVIKSLGSKVVDYKFICTGHSLGAVLAELTAVYLGMHYFPVKSITFDSPGSKPLVEKLIKGTGFDYRKLDIEVYNSNPNFINKLNEQIGQVFQILIDRDFEQTVTSSIYFNKFKEYFANYTVSSISKQIESHSLENFTKCFSQDKNKLYTPFKLEDWGFSINNIRVISYDEMLFNQLKTISKAEAQNNILDNLIMFKSVEIEEDSDETIILIDTVTCDTNDILLARQFKLIECEENSDWVIITGANQADIQ